MNVLLYTDADVFAGTERHILALAAALRDHNITPYIACPAPSPLADQAAAANIPLVPIPKRGLIDVAAARQIRRLVKSNQIDLVHAHNGRTRLAAAIGLYGTRAKLVATQHFLDPAHTRRRGFSAMISRVLHGWMNRRVHRFVAISQAVADAVGPRDHIARDRITVIHNGLPDLPAVSRATGFPSPLIVCAARLEAEKDIATLINAMNLLRQKHPEAHCVIAGKGSLHDTLARQITDLNLSDRVQLLGFRSDVPAVMAAGDIFVLPSLAEPFGLVLLEAMALSKPVVATRVAGPVEIVENNKTGLLVPPADPQALANAITHLLSNSALAAEMGRAGHQRFESHFTAQRMAAATADLYRQVLIP